MSIIYPIKVVFFLRTFNLSTLSLISTEKSEYAAKFQLASVFHYGILWNSCLLSISPYISTIHVFSKFKTFDIPRLHGVIQGCWFLLSPIYQHFFHIFASFFSTCSEFLRGIWFLIILPIVYKTGLYGLNVGKYGSWHFFNVWKPKREILVLQKNVSLNLLSLEIFILHPSCLKNNWDTSCSSLIHT